MNVLTDVMAKTWHCSSSILVYELRIVLYTADDATLPNCTTG